jgi:hypothetical protein
MQLVPSHVSWADSGGQGTTSNDGVLGAQVLL